VKAGEIWEPKLEYTEDDSLSFGLYLSSKVKIRGISGEAVGFKYIDLEGESYDILNMKTFVSRYKKVYNEEG